MQKPIKYFNKKLAIMGTLHIPEDKENFPGVVLFHGFTSNRVEPHRLFWKISKKLEENGVASIRFDFRGCGESEGDSTAFTIKDYVSDAKKVIKKLLKLKGIDQNNIGIIGLSMGSIVASYVACEFPNIKKAALISAIARPDEIFFSKPKKENPEFLPQYKNGTVDVKGNQYSKKFFDIAKRMKPLEKIKDFSGQVLLISSDSDQYTPIDHMKAYAQTVKSSKQVVINNTNHTFDNAEKEKDVISSIVNFFKA
ncbi:MAG: alpha/beta fold hydrolase [bacterium]|nr:alpha/beta fold hydrolase [bacterium]